MPADIVGDVAKAGAVFLAAGTDENAAAAAPQSEGVDSGAFEGLPGGFEKQSLLRVHRERFARRDPEEAGVEFGGLVDEAALARVARARPVGLRVVQRVGVPATVLRPLGNGVLATVQQPPEFLRRAHTPGEAAAHPDDCDRLLLLRFQLLQAPTGLMQVRGDPLEVVPKPFFIRHVELAPYVVDRNGSPAAFRNGRAPD
ncbi:hypothetical protein Stsp01_55440 [Streptomyces sp. NBRC 13847]|nr:hypothetical protein Stsp01_55440 [Streptomyces sp. NBRC 13847]